VPNGTGLTSEQLAKFPDVVFVLLNVERQHFYVLIGADIVPGTKGKRADPNEKFRIDFTDAASVEKAWKRVAERVAELVTDDRCEKYDAVHQALSRNHSVEADGMAIFKRIAEKIHPLLYVEHANNQANTTDVYYAGEKVQAKAASKLYSKDKYQFHLHHGREGNRRPYATEDNLAFAFVVTTCETSCYLVPAKFAVEHELVGEKAKATIRLPDPAKCPPDHDFAEFIMRMPPSQ
jgi:hypothetical protein